MKKIILITGTSSGFGKLMTITLSGEGHTVIAAMRATSGKNKSVAEELSALPHVEVVEMDILSDDSVQSAVAATLAKYGRIDVLVNNAGVAGFGLVEGYSIEQVKKMFDVNFYGVLRTYQAVLPAMREAKKGLIINITTGASGFALPFMVPYMASKFAVETLTEGIQSELKDYNIENVSIQSGVYPTEMNSGAKTGILADLPQVIASYGQSSGEQFATMGGALFGKMAEFDMNPQTIADGVLELVRMPDGTRPLRFPLDAVAQGTDREFIQARKDIKERWMASYGFSV